MKYLSILFFLLALICPFIFLGTIGPILLVVILLALGSFTLRQHYKKLASQKSEQALAGNIDWDRYNQKQNTMDISISSIDSFVRYGVPVIAITVFLIGMRAQAFILGVLYCINIYLDYRFYKNKIKK